METPRALPPQDDEDDDTAIVAAFLASAGGLTVAAPDAPTGVVLESASEPAHRSPTSSCQASSSGPDDEDLLAGLL